MSISVSFEFFPPGDAEMEATLWKSVERLAPLAPRFVSVTYGADGSTRERTHKVDHAHSARDAAHRRAASHLRRRAARRSARHRAPLLGSGHSPPRRAARRSGARRPRATCRIREGFAYAADLVAGLKSVADFDISVAAYPEMHPEAPSAAVRSRQSQAQDRRRRVARDHAVLLRRRCVPALPRSVRRGRASTCRSCPASCRSRASRRCCGSPRAAAPRFRSGCSIASHGLDDDADTRRLIAASVAIEQVQALDARGVREFHFYTLNRAELTYAICHALGVRPGAAAPCDRARRRLGHAVA